MTMIKSFDGCRLNAVSEGPANAPALMLSHHLGGSLAFWDAQVQAFSSTFRIIRYDTRGQGASDAPDGPYSVEMLGKDALTIMDELQLARVHFAGLSQGAMAGMWLAANNPDKIERLVLANTTPFIPNKSMWDDLIATAHAKGMDDIARRTIENWLSDGFKARNPAQTQALIDCMRTMKVAGFAGNCAVLRDIDLRDRLDNIGCPTLVIGGAEDGPRGAAAPVLASGVRNGELVVIDHAAHLTAIENPNDFNRAMGEFLT